MICDIEALTPSVRTSEREARILGNDSWDQDRRTREIDEYIGAKSYQAEIDHHEAVHDQVESVVARCQVCLEPKEARFIIDVTRRNAAPLIFSIRAEEIKAKVRSLIEEGNDPDRIQIKPKAD